MSTSDHEPLIIRPVDLTDVPALAAIRAEVWESAAYWDKRIHSYLAGHHHPQKALPERAVFVAEQNGSVVGFIAGHRTLRFGCGGELQWVNVGVSHRGHGVAAQLMAAMAAWFREQNVCRVCVNVAPENTAAVAFYAKFGATSFSQFWMVWDDIRTIHSPDAASQQSLHRD